jgi:hypothetical protein
MRLPVGALCEQVSVLMRIFTNRNSPGFRHSLRLSRDKTATTVVIPIHTFKTIPMPAKKPAAKPVAKVTAKKAPAIKKAVAKAAPAELKPIKEALTKSALIAKVAEVSAVEVKDVKKVLAAIEAVTLASVSKKGLGQFTLPGLLKVVAVNIPAKPKRKGINPFTKEEQVFAAKPATIRVKVRPLKKLKDAAL